jgi:hypothetical protein
MRRWWLLGLSCFVVSCGGVATGHDAVPPVVSAASPAASVSAPAPVTTAAQAPEQTPDVAPAAYVPPPPFPPSSPTPAPLAASVRDAKIVTLARAATRCQFEQGDIDRECKAFGAWSDEVKLFEARGELTLLSLLEDHDAKLRQVASTRHFHKPAELFADRENARRLLAIAARETDGNVAEALGERVTAIDAEKLGLQSEFFALTHHPVQRFRMELALDLLGHNPSAFNLVVAEGLMNDADARVQGTAIDSLATQGSTRETDGMCALLAKQMTRADEPGAHALMTAGRSSCASVFPQLVKALEARVNGMKDHDLGILYGLSASFACRPRATLDDAALAAMRKRLFAVGQALLGTRDASLLNPGIGVISACDPAAARAVLEAMLNDKDSSVVSRATDAIKRL